MQFLKILFWCLLAFVAALFTYGNWNSVPIQLWSGTEALVKLPFLLLVALLIGFLPTYIYHKTVRWRMRQRLANTERALGEARAMPLSPLSPLPAAPTSPAPDQIIAPGVEPMPEGRLV